MSNRISVVNPSEAPVSPTGAPAIPQTVVKVATVVVGAAALAITVLPPHTVAFRICTAIIGLGALLGVASPGLRKV